jgi:glutathione S-transferase/GST-like protein
MTAPIKVYYWPTSNGHKVTIALEEMGLAYEIMPVNIGRGEQFTPEFLAISPNNRMPAIIDPVGPGGEPTSVFESGAILQYLGRKSGLFYPADERSRVAVDEWLFWQMGNLGPMAGQRNHFRNYASTFLKDSRQTAYGARRYTDEVERLYGVLNKRLEGRAFICGDYTVADMISWPWVQGQSSAALEIEAFPNLLAWKQRIGEREPVQRALAQAKTIGGESRPFAPIRKPKPRARFCSDSGRAEPNRQIASPRATGYGRPPR